jgi:hypothetical protein
MVVLVAHRGPGLPAPGVVIRVHGLLTVRTPTGYCIEDPEALTNVSKGGTLITPDGSDCPKSFDDRVMRDGTRATPADKKPARTVQIAGGYCVEDAGGGSTQYYPYHPAGGYTSIHTDSGCPTEGGPNVSGSYCIEDADGPDGQLKRGPCLPTFP